MSYVRPASINEVAEYLESISYEQRDAQDLAAVLTEKWDLVGVFNSPVGK